MGTDKATMQPYTYDWPPSSAYSDSSDSAPRQAVPRSRATKVKKTSFPHHCTVQRTRDGSATSNDGTDRKYAYHRQHGTEARILEFHNFIRKASTDGKWTYVAAIAVDSAFDTGPHALLVQTAKRIGMHTYICRKIRNWLEQRLFSIR